LEIITGTQIKLVRVSNFEELQKTCSEYKFRPFEIESLKGIPQYPKNPIPLIVFKQTQYCIQFYGECRKIMTVCTMEELKRECFPIRYFYFSPSSPSTPNIDYLFPLKHLSQLGNTKFDKYNDPHSVLTTLTSLC
jgi:hypothetical protein